MVDNGVDLVISHLTISPHSRDKLSITVVNGIGGFDRTLEVNLDGKGIYEFISNTGIYFRKRARLITAPISNAFVSDQRVNAGFRIFKGKSGPIVIAVFNKFKLHPSLFGRVQLVEIQVEDHIAEIVNQFIPDFIEGSLKRGSLETWERDAFDNSIDIGLNMVAIHQQLAMLTSIVSDIASQPNIELSEKNKLNLQACNAILQRFPFEPKSLKAPEILRAKKVRDALFESYNVFTGRLRDLRKKFLKE